MNGMFLRGLGPYLTLMQPRNKRLLLRAVLATDGVTLAPGQVLHTALTDARQAVCHEIIDYADDCEQDWSVGDFVLHISTAGDGIDEEQGKNKDNRFVFVDEKDVVMVLDRNDAAVKHEALVKEAEERRLRNLGLLADPLPEDPQTELPEPPDEP